MPSSTTAPAEHTSTRPQRLLSALESVPDPRARPGRRYRLTAVLALAVTAVVAGAESFAAIAQWARESTGEQLAQFGVGPGRAPEESTLRKLFNRLDAAALDTAIGIWMFTRTTIADGGRRVIAIDGKTVRGARTRASLAPHLVAAFNTVSGTVPGQRRVDSKTNEIPTARTLLAVST